MEIKNNSIKNFVFSNVVEICIMVLILISTLLLLVEKIYPFLPNTQRLLEKIDTIILLIFLADKFGYI